MKLVIVNCGDPHEPAVVKYRPLASAYIAAYTPAGWDIELVDENFEIRQKAIVLSDASFLGPTEAYVDIRREPVGHLLFWSREGCGLDVQAQRIAPPGEPPLAQGGETA